MDAPGSVSPAVSGETVNDSFLFHATRQVRVISENQTNVSAADASFAFCYASAAMEAVVHQLDRIARSACDTVLILGPTGSGKEVLAREFHRLRGTDGQPFLAVNCASLSAHLLESELFGHVKGAFTGADRDKTGMFEAAGDGVILLDEISEIPLELQARLLRAIQERRLRRVGSVNEVPFRATVVATSNRDLANECRSRRFRTDLFYRLAIYPVYVPPLSSRQRREDILLLARHFLVNSRVLPDHAIADFTPEAEEMLLSHSWPGNVRELRNVVDRAVLMERSERITRACILFDDSAADGLPLLPESVDGRSFSPAQSSHGTFATDKESDFSLAAAEKELIFRVLKHTGGHRTRSAALLGISRMTLNAKLKLYGITRETPNLPEPAEAVEAFCG
jgi:transcriptional regulator with GAF, ATPase, and Fis domain